MKKIKLKLYSENLVKEMKKKSLHFSPRNLLVMETFHTVHIMKVTEKHLMLFTYLHKRRRKASIKLC